MAFQGSNPCDVNETVESKYYALDYAYISKITFNRPGYILI
jgi:hypothetical protein